MVQIKTKAQMYDLYEQGAFGNKLRTWDSVEDLLLSSYTGSVTARYLGDSGGGLAHYRIPVEEVLGWMVDEVKSKGLDPTKVRFNESAPDDRLVIQGEVMRTHKGLVLRYSRMKTMMRKALAEDTNHAYGLEAKLILKSDLMPASYYDIMCLMEQYQDAVIEFSTYEMPVGNGRARNTAIWEVRHY